MWIEKLPNGKYKYFERYKDEFGRTKKVSVTLDKNTSQSKNQAIKLLLEKIEKKTKVKKTCDLLFWDVADEVEKKSEHIFKQSTLRAHRTFKKILKTQIPEGALLTEINKAYALKILESVYYENDLSKAYMTGIKAYMSRVFEHAVNCGYVEHNPTKELKISPKQETLEQQVKKTEKYLELDELKEVLELAEQKNHRYRLLIEFLSLTGLRQGECLALQLKNIDGEKIKIEGTYDCAAKIKTTPKNRKSCRDVTLNKRALKILNEVIRENIEMKFSIGSPDDYIWVNLKTGNILNDSNFYLFLKKLGYKKHLSSHIFRHTHISLLTELNVPLKAIMDRVGHSNPETTLKIYSHVTDKLKESVASKLDKLPL